MGPRLLLNLRAAHYSSGSDTLNGGQGDNSMTPLRNPMKPQASEELPRIQWERGSGDLAIELDEVNLG